LRDEFLNETLFTSPGQAKMALEDWRRDFNEVRPHSSIGWKTPAEFAAEFAARRAKALALLDGSAPWPVAHNVLEDVNRRCPIEVG
jgi:putative transposase